MYLQDLKVKIKNLEHKNKIERFNKHDMEILIKEQF